MEKSVKQSDPASGHNRCRRKFLDQQLGHFTLGRCIERYYPELRDMRREVRLGLEAGARMLSFGLVYLPGAYAGTDELDQAALAAIDILKRWGCPRIKYLGLIAAPATRLVTRSRRASRWNRP